MVGGWLFPQSAYEAPAHAAADEAAQVAAEGERTAEREDRKALVRAFRRVLSCKAHGREPEAEAVERLSPGLRAYVSALTLPECEALLAASGADLFRLVRSETSASGALPAAEVLAPAAAKLARREQVRAQLRVVRGEQAPDADEVLRRMGRAA